jgi:hypothetical protein
VWRRAVQCCGWAWPSWQRRVQQGCREHQHARRRRRRPRATGLALAARTAGGRRVPAHTIPMPAGRRGRGSPWTHARPTATLPSQAKFCCAVSPSLPLARPAPSRPHHLPPSHPSLSAASHPSPNEPAHSLQWHPGVCGRGGVRGGGGGGLTRLLHASRHIDGAAESRTQSKDAHRSAPARRGCSPTAMPARAHANPSPPAEPCAVGEREAACQRARRPYLPNTWKRGCFLPSTPHVMSPCRVATKPLTKKRPVSPDSKSGGRESKDPCP